MRTCNRNEVKQVQKRLKEVEYTLHGKRFCDIFMIIYNNILRWVLCGLKFNIWENISLKKEHLLHSVSLLFPSGCSSELGRQGGKQTIYIGTMCSSLTNIVHEVMHALGFMHEHQRPDRDTFIEIIWKNIIPGKLHEQWLLIISSYCQMMVKLPSRDRVELVT
jgi:hypothetical protein